MLSAASTFAERFRAKCGTRLRAGTGFALSHRRASISHGVRV